MCVVAIVGSGPKAYLPDLTEFEVEVDVWIGADLGGIAILEQGMPLNYAVGDFDSVTAEQKEIIFKHALNSDVYSDEKNETDLEIALNKAYGLKAETIYLFGVTGGRLDHALINVQLLHGIINKKIRGIIIDCWNKIELKKPGTHTVLKNELYSYISFVPFTEYVKKISLSGFTYSLTDHDIAWGSTRLISNELELEIGSFSFEEGLLLLIESCDNEEKK